MTTLHLYPLPLGQTDRSHIADQWECSRADTCLYEDDLATSAPRDPERAPHRDDRPDRLRQKPSCGAVCAPTLSKKAG